MSHPTQGTNDPPLATPASPSRARNTKFCGVIAFTLLLSTLVLLHTPGLNGSWFWYWLWIRLDPTIYAALALAAIPLLAAQYLYPRRIGAGVGLTLVAASFLAMMFAAAHREGDPLAFGRITRVVGDPVHNSYFRQAGNLLLDGIPDQPRWLARYPDLMPTMFLHCKTKPPGPVLFYMPLIRCLGFNESAALAGGLAVGLLALGSIPATYWMLRSLTGGNRAAAFHATSLLALTPGMVLFFPYWDQLYPIATALLLTTWAAAVDRGRARYAVLFGLALAVICFFTYNLLVLGVFLGTYGLLKIWRDPRRAETAVLVVRQSIIALTTLAAAYLLLWFLTGFDPLTTLRTAIADQHELEKLLKRPYPWTIPFDLLDFALGSGWLPVLLATYYLYRRLRPPIDPSPGLRVTLLGLLQFAVVAITGLLATENVRVWTFMLPLLLLPAGLELADWSPRQRFLTYLCSTLLLAVIAQNMRFIYLVPP